ncbi:hypothetical protein Y032_0168g156 [Ancylostoma ceylanicum]|nr:hypothetical protein Y032_0168g156 [Ancylostoma ceylanicum]
MMGVVHYIWKRRCAQALRLANLSDWRIVELCYTPLSSSSHSHSQIRRKYGGSSLGTGYRAFRKEWKLVHPPNEVHDPPTNTHYR